MTEWKGLLGRISIFQVPSSASPSPIEMLRKIWGVDPDNFKKQQNPLLPSTADSTLNGLTVHCSTQPGRIDLNITPPAVDSADMSIGLIDDTGTLYAELVRIIKAIPQLGIPGPVTRVAIVARFGNLSKSGGDANRILSNVIPEEYRVRITDETDFILQLNRLFTSRSVDRITMNALKRWSVDRVQLMAINMQAGGNLVTGGNSLTSEFMANVMLEVNNVPVAENSLKTVEQVSLLEEGLKVISEYQKDTGLGVKGF